MKTLSDISLQDLLPESLLTSDTVKRASNAIDPQLTAVAENVGKALIFARVDELTGEQLDHLAAQFHVVTWNSFWDKDQKLAVLKATVEMKRRRGTAYAVRTAVESILSPFTITEWWQEDPKGEPYTFDIEIPLDDIGKDLTFEDQEDLADLVYEAKSIRSHNTFTLKRTTLATIRIGSIMHSYTQARITGEVPPVVTELNLLGEGTSAIYVRI